MRFSGCEYGQFLLRLLLSRAIAETGNYVPIGFLQILGIWFRGDPKVDFGVNIVVRLFRCAGRWEEAHIRLHHADHCGGNLPAADAHGLADDLGISAKLALPELIAEHDCFCGPLLEVDIGEAASCRRAETHNVHVVSGDHHPLHGVAAVIVNQEIEGPIVAGDSL